MPNPPIGGTHRNDQPLDEAVNYATHVVVRCTPPIGHGFKPCGRSVIWRTEELYAKLPRCRTLREFKERLYCKRCKRRGWLAIEEVRR